MKRSIGIEITENRICIVQLNQRWDRLYLERIHVRQLPNETLIKMDTASDLRAELKAAISEGGFDTLVPVVVAMPYGRVFFSKFRTGIPDDKDIQQLLKYEVEDDFPIPFDDLIVDTCGYCRLKGQDREILVGGANRSQLHSLVEVVREAGFHCSAVSADICALRTLAALNGEATDDIPSIVIYIDGQRVILGVIKSNGPICVRYLSSDDRSEIDMSALMREIELTVTAASELDDSVPSRVLLSGDGDLVHALSEELSQETRSEIVILDPHKHIQCTSQQQKDDQLAIALGLALIGINRSSEDLDFLAVDKAKAGRTAKTRRSAIVFGLLLAAAAVILVVHVFVQLIFLEEQHERIKQEIRKVFTQTIPEEKRIVNELAQLDERFKALQQEYGILSSEIGGRVPSLRILQYISEKITPDQNLSVSSISMSADTVRLSGVATSFDSVDKLVGVLRQIVEFDSAELRNVDIDPTSSRVRFGLLITLAMK